LHEEERPLATVIVQAATLIAGCLLILSASILFAGLMIGDPSPAIAITALGNAALFYLWGMGIIVTVFKTWKAAPKQDHVTRSRP